MINICNQHLQFDFKSHFSITFSCNDCCIMFALGDLTDIAFQVTVIKAIQTFAQMAF